MSVWHKIYTIPASPTENFQCFYLPILWTTQSCWQRGQRLFCFTHNDMQQLWKEWLHSPQTTTQSSCLFSAWHLRQASMTCTRQMAQVSHSTSQLHMATAFHFFSENILSGPPALEAEEPGCEWGAPGSSPSSTSAMAEGRGRGRGAWRRAQAFSLRLRFSGSSSLTEKVACVEESTNYFN